MKKNLKLSRKRVARMDKTDYTYDVFISYRWVDPDQAWVRDQLEPALRTAKLKTCLDVEDFVPGRDLILEMHRAGKESRHVLCILSPDYFEGDRMVGFESLMARRNDPSGTKSKLIPLIFRKVELPDWLRGLIPTDWTEPKNHSREWRKLLQVLAAPNQNAPEPSAIPESVEPEPNQASPSHVLEACRSLSEKFQPSAIDFDAGEWLREADRVTMDIWHAAGKPNYSELEAVLNLWQM